MHQQFLCPVHRKWVSMYPLEALEHIDVAKCKGDQLRQQQRWSEALPFLGSALEMTEIVMKEEPQISNRLGLLYTALSVEVADTFYRLEEPLLASDFLIESADWLHELSCSGNVAETKKTRWQECISTLKRGAVFFTEILQHPHVHHRHVNLH
ncbi:hypothetical protein [Alteromonas sp. a30]|uniref:hypothetical protein n=1 Tax=Alteromonas sp. a30 TaxID=2730917 RepID=UPI00227F7804|nr:hypothetical protein [Alteromonas sp. a30]MCY7295779.1 hypothetical protein [Alteromonas sp. a30]